MKIYYVANARMPTEKAHGIQLAKMCEAFIEAGAEILLIVPRRRTVSRTIQEYYGLRVAIPVVRIPVLDWYGGRVGFVIGSCAFMLGYSAYLIWQRLRGKKGIIYTTDIDQFSFAAIPFLGMPYFAEIHDAKEKGLLFSLFFGRAQGLMVINNLIKEKILRTFGVNSEKIVVHPNGIDLAYFSNSISRQEAREKLGLPNGQSVALYAGKFYPWKGLGILSDTAGTASGVQFYLVGGDKEEYSRVTSKPLFFNMNFIGYREYGEMPYWLAAADILVVLGTAAVDYSYFHTSPMKLFEYMASKRPIIAAETPANRQIVTDEEVFFYRADDPRALAGKIDYVFSHPEEASGKAEAAFNKAKYFTWERRAGSILQFMKDYLSRTFPGNHAVLPQGKVRQSFPRSPIPGGKVRDL